MEFIEDEILESEEFDERYGGGGNGGGFILGYRKGQEEGLEQVYKICDRLGLTAEEVEKITK